MDSKWEVITVLVVLVPFIAIFVKAAWSIAKSSQSLSDNVKILQISIEDLKTDSKDLKTKVDEHEHRITVLEEHR